MNDDTSDRAAPTAPDPNNSPDPNDLDVPRPWLVKATLAAPFGTAEDVVAWAHAHGLFYSKKTATSNTLEFKVANDELQYWRSAISNPSADGHPSLSFAQTQARSRNPAPTPDRIEFVIRGLAVGEDIINRAETQRQLDASLQHLAPAGSFPIHRTLQSGASHLAFFYAPTNLTLPPFVYIGEDGCFLEKAGDTASDAERQKSTVVLGGLTGHLRCARNLDPIKRSVKAIGIFVPGLYSKRNARLQKGSVAHVVFESRALAIDFMEKKSGVISLRGREHPIRLLTNDSGTRITRCWRCWEAGHFSTDCDSPAFNPSSARSRATSTRNARQEREYNQLAMNTLPVERVPVVTQRFLSAAVHGDRARLPTNSVTYALIASRVVPSMPAHALHRTPTVTPADAPPRPPVASPASPPPAPAETSVLASIHAQLSALLGIATDLQARVQRLEQSSEVAALQKQVTALARQVSSMTNSRDDVPDDASIVTSTPTPRPRRENTTAASPDVSPVVPPRGRKRLKDRKASSFDGSTHDETETAHGDHSSVPGRQ